MSNTGDELERDLADDLKLVTLLHDLTALLAKMNEKGKQHSAETVEKIRMITQTVGISDVTKPTTVMQTVEHVAPVRQIHSLADEERDYIIFVLAFCGGNRTRAAEALGISTKGLFNKLREYSEDAVLANKIKALCAGIPDIDSPDIAAAAVTQKETQNDIKSGDVASKLLKRSAT